MKKKAIVIVICLAVLALAAIIFFRPVPIIAAPNDAAGGGFELLGIYCNGADVTGDIDSGTLAEILSGYRCRRSFRHPFPYESADAVWEINLVYDSESLHIVLGKNSFCYNSADDFITRTVTDAQSLMDELAAIIG